MTGLEGASYNRNVVSFNMKGMLQRLTWTMTDCRRWCARERLHGADVNPSATQLNKNDGQGGGAGAALPSQARLATASGECCSSESRTQGAVCDSSDVLTSS